MDHRVEGWESGEVQDIPPRSQHSHPLGKGVFDPSQRRGRRDLRDQVRVFLASLLQHLPGRKPEIGAVVPRPPVGMRPGPWVGECPESQGTPRQRSTPEHPLSGWDGPSGQCWLCQGSWGVPPWRGGRWGERPVGAARAAELGCAVEGTWPSCEPTRAANTSETAAWNKHPGDTVASTPCPGYGSSQPSGGGGLQPAHLSPLCSQPPAHPSPGCVVDPG